MSTEIKSQIKSSPGTELNRLMDAMGLPERLGDLYGTALDRAINNDLGVARNFLDAFSSLTTNDLDRALGGKRLAEAGHFPRPKDVFKDALNNKKNSYYERERIQAFDLGQGDMSAFMIDGKVVNLGEKMSPAAFEAKLRLNKDFRKDIEQQLGARIVLHRDEKWDGKITIAKPRLEPSSILRPPQKTLADMQKKFVLLNNSGGSQNYRTTTDVRDHRTSSTSGDVRDHRTASPNSEVRDHRTPSITGEIRDHRTSSSSSEVRDHRTTSNSATRDHRTHSSSGFISNNVADALFDQLYGHLTAHEQAHQTAEAPAQSDGGTSEGAGSDLRSILNDPSLPFEEKLALFLFAFVQKRQKEIEKKTAALEQKKKATDGGNGGGGFLKTLGTIGGAAAGGYFGGPQGAGVGANIGGMVGGALEGGGNGTGDAGKEEDSEQVAMKKLQMEVEEMNKMFTMIDNLLTGMNRVVREGPLAALRG